jgi:hypothetical protein
MKPIYWLIIGLALLRGTTFSGPESACADDPPQVGAAVSESSGQAAHFRSDSRAAELTRLIENDVATQALTLQRTQILRVDRQLFQTLRSSQSRWCEHTLHAQGILWLI